MKVVFCIYNFVKEKLPLQPWLTIDEVATRMVADGYEVHIVTDTHDDAVTGFNIHVVDSLRGSNKEQIHKVVDAIEPDVIVTLITPLNLATGGWISRYKKSKVIAFSSYPFYNLLEMIRAIPHVNLSELKSYLRHLLVPGFLWKPVLRKHFSSIICQSESGRERLVSLLGDATSVHAIQPGIDRKTWIPTMRSKNDSGKLKLLYLGTASPIRGFNICLKAFKRVCNKDISLTILARGASDEQVIHISKQLDDMGISQDTQLIGGWIDREGMIEHINDAALVVLPFVLVPSELPVSVMEVIACGTPVLTTNIDGLPSTVGAAGKIVQQGSVTSLVDVINTLYEDRAMLSTLSQNCVTETDMMMTWDSMYRRWLDEIDTTHDK